METKAGHQVTSELPTFPALPVHILFLADNFPPERNAQASLVYERACFWAKWGHRVTVITCAPNFPEGKVYPGYRNRWYQVEEMSGIRVVRVKTFIAANSGRILRILDFLSFMFAAVAAGLVQERPDVVVATSPQFFTAVGGWLLSSLRKLRFVFEVRDLWPDSIVAVGAMGKSMALRLIEKLELFLYRQAAAVVVLTPAFRENLLRRGVPASKIHVVLSGVDLSRYQPCARDPELAARIGLGSGDFVIGYLGTFGMAHALTNVLDAAELLATTPVRFLLVGAGKERDELIEQAQRRGLGNVLFVPPQAKEDIPRFWGLCDVSLVHLRNTPLFATVIPSKIFESMGMGLPILLAAPKGEASRIIEEQDMGVWVEAENPQALAKMAMRLQADRTLIQRLGRNSLAAAPRFSREQKSEEMLRVLQSVCPGHAMSAAAVADTSANEQMTSSLAALGRTLDASRGVSPQTTAPVLSEAESDKTQSPV